MFKVIFYRVFFNNNIVCNYVRGKRDWKPRNRVQRAEARPLFSCYCVNMFQLQKIKKFLETTIPYTRDIFTYSVGYKVIK